MRRHHDDDPAPAGSLVSPATIIIVCALGLTFLGLTILFSASAWFKKGPYFYLNKQLIGVVAQKNAEVEDPQQGDLYTVGVVCMILKLFKLPDGNQSIIVHGLTRFRLKNVTQNEPYARGETEILEDILPQGPHIDALLASVRQQANRVIELSPNTPDEAAQVLVPGSWRSRDKAQGSSSPTAAAMAPAQNTENAMENANRMS